MSYEEERSQIDFDDVVRQNQQKYKEETKLSNEQVGGGPSPLPTVLPRAYKCSTRL